MTTTSLEQLDAPMDLSNYLPTPALSPNRKNNLVTLLALSSRQIASEITHHQAPATRNHSSCSAPTHPEDGSPVGRRMPILGRTSPAASHPRGKTRPYHKTTEEPKPLEKIAHQTTDIQHSSYQRPPNHNCKIISQ